MILFFFLVDWAVTNNISFFQAIYGTYIVQDSKEDIGISMSTRKKIQKSMIPPFDELFDEAEEHILKILIVPWNKLLSVDHATYSKVSITMV